MQTHKIRKVRTKLPRRVMPLWTQNDGGVATFLRTKFPLTLGRTNNSLRQFMRAKHQWQKALVYNEVLYMFYRLNMTEGEIATKLRDRLDRKNAIDAVRDIVKVIRKYKPCASNDL